MSFYLSLVLLLHQDQVCYHPYRNGIPSNTLLYWTSCLLLEVWGYKVDIWPQFPCKIHAWNCSTVTVSKCRHIIFTCLSIQSCVLEIAPTWRMADGLSVRTNLFSFFKKVTRIFYKLLIDVDSHLVRVGASHCGSIFSSDTCAIDWMIQFQPLNVFLRPYLK